MWGVECPPVRNNFVLIACAATLASLILTLIALVTLGWETASMCEDNVYSTFRLGLRQYERDITIYSDTECSGTVVLHQSDTFDWDSIADDDKSGKRFEQMGTLMIVCGASAEFCLMIALYRQVRFFGRGKWSPITYIAPLCASLFLVTGAYSYMQGARNSPSTWRKDGATNVPLSLAYSFWLTEAAAYLATVPIFVIRLVFKAAGIGTPDESTDHHLRIRRSWEWFRRFSIRGRRASTEIDEFRQSKGSPGGDVHHPQQPQQPRRESRQEQEKEPNVWANWNP